jgi:transcriptional regulator with XRE-family HTH domain
MGVLDDAMFRTQLADLLVRTGLSQRGLSAAFGRDPGYVQALLDPTRPSRARPTPDDLIRAADATGITLVELLDKLWGIEPSRLAAEAARLGVGSSSGQRMDALSDQQRREVADYVEFLATRGRGSGRTR